MDVRTRKKNLRVDAINKRDSLTSEEILKNSEKIFSKLKELPEFINAKTVMIYLNFKSEVVTDSIVDFLLSQGKKIVVPICIKEPRSLLLSHITDPKADCDIGFYGIRTPREDNVRETDPKEVDFVVVPGVAFSRDKYRLGYGGGYYDRFIKTLREDAFKCSLAFDVQIYDEVPIDRYDEKMDLIVTEREIIR
ncbi:5-formyltetrahydrofolate cyclo-ligase [Acetoanaerobium pronyense]|uniref:5-formyltetrahydrofolate cyclo-ligase n=1 Tax=Acetoanaerobium pronyense TaxID=1482736 RepID=A0ABS4KJN7_9FIRM|nr:5-formyltetrahydrofolate cyclo-ligase [Acetoanaerobium pronyense]MBP2027965.1 5-formyltetrahydrofolate cyclo-ligase [Acetoanaerobium pronyense]